MSLTRAFVSGLFGACFLTLVHEVLRRLVPDAPRMDVLGKEALALLYENAGRDVPDEETLHYLAMAGDLVSNTAYYTLVGAGAEDGAEVRGALLGAGSGVAAVVLPKYLGLDEGASARRPVTAVLTIGLYTAGGLAAAAAYRLLGRE